MKTYELYNLTTGEILADNLTFDEIPELFDAYANFYDGDEIVACYRAINIKQCRKVVNPDEKAYNEFLKEWFNFVEEIITLDNLH